MGEQETLFGLSALEHHRLGIAQANLALHSAQVFFDILKTKRKVNVWLFRNFVVSLQNQKLFMKAKEPVVRYNAMPSTSTMRSRLVQAFENENDADFIQTMYVYMLQKRDEQQAEHRTKYSLSELKGIIAMVNDNEMSYDDMRMAYMKEKFSL